MTPLADLSEQEKTSYIETFWESVEPLVIKQRLNKKLRKTSYKITSASSTNRYGVKKRVVVKNGKASIGFTIEAIPWEWANGTVYVETKIEFAKNTLIPYNKIEPKAEGGVWKPNFDLIFFLKNTTAISSYLSYVELTWTDLGLFDTVEAAIRSIIP